MEECKFKVGMKVMSVTTGVGVVSAIDEKGDCPVRVNFLERDLEDIGYTKEGMIYSGDLYPEIYLDGDIHPLLRVPVRLPKEKVKKEITMYANVYYNTWEGEYTAAVYSGKKEAEEHAMNNVIAKAVPIKVEFETEEIV